MIKIQQRNMKIHKFLLAGAAALVLTGCLGTGDSSTAVSDAASTETVKAEAEEENKSLAAAQEQIPVQTVQVLSMGESLLPSLSDLPEQGENPIPSLLRAGVEHPYVASLQQRLMELGFMDNDEPTQYFGTVTESAVKIFQRQNGLEQDGIAGRPSGLRKTR